MGTWFQRVLRVPSEVPASASVEQSGGPRLSHDEQTHKETTQDPEFAARDRMDYETSLTLFVELVRTRFQLLGLLPLISGGVIALLERLSAEPIVLIGPALLGFIVTAGLVVYEIRNSQIHDNLVHRLRHLERVLGLIPATPDQKARGGFFLERSTRQIYLRPMTSDWSSSAKPSSRARLKLKVRHDAGLSVVYGAVMAAWAAFFTWNAGSVLADALSGSLEARVLSILPGALTIVAGFAAGLLGWRIISAASMMGRNVTRVYQLEPLAVELLGEGDEQTAHSSELDFAATLISGLFKLDVPMKKSGEDEYRTFRETAGKEMVHFWESLGRVEASARALGFSCPEHR